MEMCRSKATFHVREPAGHHFEVTGLLAYSEAAFNANPRALVVSVAAESFDFQDHLAPNVEAALPEVIDYIRKIVYGADSGLSVQKSGVELERSLTYPSSQQSQPEAKQPSAATHDIRLATCPRAV